jgi:F-type H+-transporting ATPase subunit epsilon
MRLVTPEGEVFSDSVLAITLPGELGEMQLFADHVPLLSRLVPGALRILLPDGRTQDYTVEEGFARVSFEEVCVLVDAAQSGASASLQG